MLAHSWDSGCPASGVGGREGLSRVTGCRPPLPKLAELRRRAPPVHTPRDTVDAHGDSRDGRARRWGPLTALSGVFRYRSTM